MTNPKRAASGFIAELRRRRVLRTLALYIVGAWVLMQVADVVFPALDIPERAIRYLLLAAVVGFPVALVFGWFFDITADGIQRTGRADAAEAEAALRLRAPDYILLAALAAVLAAIVYGTVGTVVELPVDARDTSPVAGRPREAGLPMVGVLPFTYRGTGEDAEFFAGGVHDDLLTQLSRLSGLRVVSRTSVLAYENTTKTIPVIGSELGADVILEGGVQVAAGHIRINAQLIDARSDEHLWAETFDRELTPANLFAVQTDIAQAIARALQATLTQGEVDDLGIVPTDSMAAYRAYHSGMEKGSPVSGNSDVVAAQADLERAIDLDPRFTLAMSELVGLLAARTRVQDDARIERIEELVARIGDIAPGSVEHLQAQAFYTYYLVRDYALADELISAARTRAPSNLRLLTIQTYIARRAGDYERLLELTREGLRLEPSVPLWDDLLVNRLMLLRRYRAARDHAVSMEDRNDFTEFTLRKLALAEHGDLARYGEEIKAYNESLPSESRRSRAGDQLFEAYLLNRNFSAAASLLAEFPDSTDEALAFGYIPFNLFMPMVLHLLSGDQAALADAASTVVDTFSFDDSLSSPVFLDLHPQQQLFLALASGKRREARLALEKLQALIERDGTERLGRYAEYCRGLALLERAGDTVRCLRNATREPGYALPFLEPHLPFYDAVRDAAPFRQMMAEFAGTDWLAPYPGQ